MELFLRVIQVLLAIALIGVVLLQRSEGGGLGIGSSGGMGSFMSVRGTANFLTRVTSILGALFMITCLALALIAHPAEAPRSIFDVPTPVPAAPAPEPSPAPAANTSQSGATTGAAPAPVPATVPAPLAVPPVVATPTVEVPAPVAQPPAPPAEPAAKASEHKTRKSEHKAKPAASGQ